MQQDFQRQAETKEADEHGQLETGEITTNESKDFKRNRWDYKPSENFHKPYKRRSRSRSDSPRGSREKPYW